MGIICRKEDLVKSSLPHSSRQRKKPLASSKGSLEYVRKAKEPHMVRPKRIE